MGLSEITHSNSLLPCGYCLLFAYYKCTSIAFIFSSALELERYWCAFCVKSPSWNASSLLCCCTFCRRTFWLAPRNLAAFTFSCCIFTLIDPAHDIVHIAKRKKVPVNLKKTIKIQSHYTSVIASISTQVNTTIFKQYCQYSCEHYHFKQYYIHGYYADLVSFVPIL